MEATELILPYAGIEIERLVRQYYPDMSTVGVCAVPTTDLSITAKTSLAWHNILLCAIIKT